jgi:hypothetical protein
MSELLEVRTSDVQRDYLYGWLLADLYGASLKSSGPGGAVCHNDRCGLS